MTARVRGSFWALGFLLALGCGNGESDPPADGPYVLTISGDEVSDTIAARVATPLTATVTQGGRPARDVWVRFRPVGCDYYCAGTAPLNSDNYYIDEFAGRSDGNGRVQIKVQLNYRAGTSLVLAQLEDSSASDTASYTVLPGKPAAVTVWGNPDSAVVLGASYTPRIVVVDQGGNELPIPVTITASSPAVAQVSGGTVTGLAYGTSVLLARATAGSWSGQDTASVTVVPGGKLTLTSYWGTELSNTDGGHHSRILPIRGTAVWSPDGQTLAYDSYFSEGLKLLRPDGTTIRQLIPLDLYDPAMPIFSGDGNWIYFCAGPTSGAAPSIWRVHPDATGLEQISQPATEGEGGDCSPSPSPDGTRLLYATTRGGTASRLVIKNLSTGVITELGIFGSLPSWAPAGGHIAYWEQTDTQANNRLFVVSDAGGASTQLTSNGDARAARVAWSADGVWIAANLSGALGNVWLIRVNDNLQLALPWTYELEGYSWSPGSAP